MHAVRETRIEILRIIATVMIIAHHYFIHGLFIWSGYMDVFNSGRLTNKIVMSLYYPGGYVGVGLFFMITGYFGIYKTATKARLKNLCVEILHYALLSAAVTMIWSFFDTWDVTLQNIYVIITLFRPFTGVWWYIAIYLILVLAMPYKNRCMLSMKSGYQKIVVLLAWMGMLAACLIDDNFCFERALFYYLLGTEIRLWADAHGCKNVYIKPIPACILAVASWCAGAYSFYRYFQTQDMKWFAVGYLIATPVICVLLYFAFLGMPIRNNERVNMIAGCSLGVYLLHDNKGVRQILWQNICQVEKQFASPWLPALSIATILAVYTACCFIDRIRAVLLPG